MSYLTEMDSSVLDQLMHDYGQDVWNYAYLICKKREWADDISQDVFLRAYQNIASYRGEASVKTWLLKITRNVSYNYRNTAFLRRVLLVDAVQPAGEHPSAEEVFWETEAANDVWRAVFRLPAKYREIITLDARHQLSMSELAQILGVAEGTVKSRLHRARQKLALILEAEKQQAKEGET